MAEGDAAARTERSPAFPSKDRPLWPFQGDLPGAPHPVLASLCVPTPGAASSPFPRFLPIMSDFIARFLA